MFYVYKLLWIASILLEGDPELVIRDMKYAVCSNEMRHIMTIAAVFQLTIHSLTCLLYYFFNFNKKFLLVGRNLCSGLLIVTATLLLEGIPMTPLFKINFIYCVRYIVITGACLGLNFLTESKQGDVSVKVQISISEPTSCLNFEALGESKVKRCVPCMLPNGTQLFMLG
jgi:hypothetical protein